MKKKVSIQEKFMLKAIALGKENLEHFNGGPFGAIVVKDNKIIASGVNTVTTDHDPTAHAEVNAIRNACKTLNSFQLEDCEIYSSCEPCPMCLGAIYWARPKNLYFGASRSDAAKAGFDDEKIYQELAIDVKNRELPTKQIHIPEALELFEMWIQSENKIDY